MHMEVVELLWWEKCGILVVMVLRNDKYESFILTGFELFFQVSKIESCTFVRQIGRDLSFDFQMGSCNTFLQPTPRILLCFSDSGNGTPWKVCHRYVRKIIIQFLNLFPALMVRIMFKWKILNTLTLIHLDLEIIATKHSRPDVAQLDVPAELQLNF